MNDHLSELDAQRERAARNQSLFREVNERLEELAGSVPSAFFICECLDQRCDEKVSLTTVEYERVRSEPNRFFVRPGHDVPDVETIVDATERYVVVSKLGAGAPVARQLDPRRRSASGSDENHG